MENPIKMDDLGVPPFLETPIYENHLWVPKMLGCLAKTESGWNKNSASNTPPATWGAKPKENNL